MFKHHLSMTDRLWPGTYAYLSEDPATDTAVVFVHGFFGDPATTWLNFQGMMDSRSDTYPEWEHCDAFFFSYASVLEPIDGTAKDLLKFLASVYPDPPTNVLDMVEPIPQIAGALNEFRLEPRTYRNLVLIGHSEGAVVIRQAVLFAHALDSGNVITSEANITLFAPAHLGFAPSSWIALCLAVGRVGAAITAVLHMSKSFVQMREGSKFLESIQDSTTKLLDSHPVHKGLRARVLFGRDDTFVAKGKYPEDQQPPPEDNQDHFSICKPTDKYPRPLGFAWEVWK